MKSFYYEHIGEVRWGFTISDPDCMYTRDAEVQQIHGPDRTVIEFFWTVRTGPDRTLKTLDRSGPVRTDLISECTLKHSIRMIFVDSFP